MNVTQPVFSYSFPSLSDLLTNGAVGFELDIRPPNDDSGDQDFPCYHEDTYDQLSTCSTFKTCLNIINQWFINNNYTISQPLLIYTELKNPSDWTSEQLQLLNSIWPEIFDGTDIYSPYYHQSLNSDDPTNINLIEDTLSDWSNVCYQDVQNMIIPLVDIKKGILDKLNDETLTNLNMFPFCDCQTQSPQYCVTLKDQCDDDELGINSTNRLKYLYRKFTALEYPQWSEYPMIYNDSGSQFLGFQVDDGLIEEIHSKFPEYEDDIINPLTLDQWQFWQTAAYLDGMNNNNGKWETDDFLKYGKALQPDRGDLDYIIPILFWKQGFDGDDILDPKLWATLECLWNDQYGLEPLVIHGNLSAVLIDICDKIDKGYHYLYTDFPYNISGSFQDFTMKQIMDNPNFCNDITITKYIKRSSIVADCVRVDELTSFLYGVVAGIIGAFLFLVIVISVCCYCFVCKKKGCRVWCQDKCCQCCCSQCGCCERKDGYDGNAGDEMEFTTYS